MKPSTKKKTIEDRQSNESALSERGKGLAMSDPERLGDDRSHSFGELNTIIERQLSVFDDSSAYKNEIWTRVQRVNIDAPEQVEVRTIRGDIQQALVNLLDEELFDDEGPEPNPKTPKPQRLDSNIMINRGIKGRAGDAIRQRAM